MKSNDKLYLVKTEIRDFHVVAKSIDRAVEKVRSNLRTCYPDESTGINIEPTSAELIDDNGVI